MSTSQFPRQPSSTALGWTLLRVVLGVTFALHGWQKFTEFTLAGTEASFTQMGVPLAGITAPAVAGLELVGGVLLLVGLGTRVIGALLALEMLGALVLVHLPNGFFAATGGIELVLILAAASAFFALAGPGPWSADRAIATQKTGYRVMA